MFFFISLLLFTLIMWLQSCRLSSSKREWKWS